MLFLEAWFMERKIAKAAENVKTLHSVTKTVKRIVFWGVTTCSLVEVSGISEEHTASIFRVEEEARQAASSQKIYIFSL
jgi:hypothetical protein